MSWFVESTIYHFTIFHKPSLVLFIWLLMFLEGFFSASNDVWTFTIPHYSSSIVIHFEVSLSAVNP